ncbi:TOM1-like protein 1 [Cricetulus griseus]|uniref:TOM1-like protein 1 n=1 Tax=Cricetulus griseus TaxID=10029 RepID=G3H1B8_CRIGR|nr:TOM1-like protein 1 [Cricetulus griseus]
MAFGKSHRDPYATSVGHLVEKATFAGVQTEDWGQFMHICDIINTTQDGPKDAVKALKKRISKNYNHKEIQLSLSLIDMCMQNCGPSFQSLIVKKEFIKDALVKLLNPRYTLPLDIQNRILNFIKGFPGGVDVSEVKEVYLDLLKKGVQFPPSDADTETRQEIGKLHSELDMVKMNVKVMTAILMENTPGSENHEDIELLQKLYKTGREMQERIMDLLVVVENEDVTVELIQVNEDLNNAILGYERFTRNQQRLLEQNRNSKDATDTSNEPSAPSCDLLDLSPIVPMPMSNGEALHTVNSQLSALNIAPTWTDDDSGPQGKKISLNPSVRLKAEKLEMLLPCDSLEADEMGKLRQERDAARAEVNVLKEAKAVAEETRALRSRLHLAEAAQRQAHGMEMDYEEVIHLLETEISELKAQLAHYSDQNKESIQDLRKRVTVLDCQLRKSEVARKTFKASTESLLHFVEAAQEVLLDSSAPFSNLSERRAVFASQTSLPLLGKNGRSFPANLLLESKELVRSVRAILDMDCLPYGWEEAYTADGIKYFINHVTQTTSWIHPVMSVLNLSCSEENEEDCPRELTDQKS